MREILFRGKRLDNGEWVYGYYIKATHHWHNHGIHEEWIATDTVQNGGWCNVRGKYAVVSETVGQYTGLTNEGGDRLYEGDIVKVTNDDGETDFADGGVGVIEFYDGLWYVSGEVNNGLNDLTKAYYIEIIGNIHDNPELLRTPQNDEVRE